MEIDINNIRRCVQNLLGFLPKNTADNQSDQLLISFLNKNHYAAADVQKLFKYLSAQVQDEAFTVPIAHAFETYLLLIVTASLQGDVHLAVQDLAAYQRECIALSTLMLFSLDVKRFAMQYFRNKPAPFQLPDTNNKAPRKKKAKNTRTDDNKQVDQLNLVRCLYRLLQSEPIYFKELWDWSYFVSQTLSKTITDELTQLYGNHVVALLSNMTTCQLHELNKHISAEAQLRFEQEKQTVATYDIAHKELPADIGEEGVITINFENFADNITSIEGVLLPIYDKENSRFYAHTDGAYDKIVKVDSTSVNLRSIALGVTAGKAICLTGPVGCGKTTLVEYLARKTGRICPKVNEITRQQKLMEKENQKDELLTSKYKSKQKLNVGTKRKSAPADIESPQDSSDFAANGFLRIQLGDQTDSKLLLGQYRCTDVPGEFIWLPGVLTQAVMHGYWLLLEDLDSATQDTYTILSSLLERNSLSVPGFRDCVKIEPGFQLFVTVRLNKSAANYAQKSLYSLLEKYLYTINILPLSRNELCKVVSTNYPKLATVANRIVDVFLTFSSGSHTFADNLRQQETSDKADTTEHYVALPFEKVTMSSVPNSGRLVSTRDLIKLCQRSNPMFSVTSAECAYFVFQNAVDVFCSYLPQGKEKSIWITSIGAKLGIIQSRCEHFTSEYKPDVQVDSERIKVGRATLYAKKVTENKGDGADADIGEHLALQAQKRQKLTLNTAKEITVGKPARKKTTFSFTRVASCILERLAVCVAHAEPVLLVGETGVGKTSSVQYLAERTQHKLVVINMNNQSDVADLVGGFKPVELMYVIAPIRFEFEIIFRKTFNQLKNEQFLNKFSVCYNQGNYNVLLKLMLTVCKSVFEKSELKELELFPRWQALHTKLNKLYNQLAKSINISFAFIPGSLVNCIKNGDWVLLDEINLASAETLECLSTILEPDGSVVLLEKGDFTPVRRHPDFRIFACMNPNTDIGKKDLSLGIRNRFTEFFVDELTTDADLSLLVGDYLSETGIQNKCVHSIVKLYKKLKTLSTLELNDGLGNRPVYSLRTLCRSLRICAKNLCGSIERNLYESFCLSFLTQLDAYSHDIVHLLIKDALLNNAKAALKQSLPKLGEDYLNFEGYWVQQGPKSVTPCENYILTDSVRSNLKDLARIISIGKLPILLQGPTSAGKTSLIDYIAKRSGNYSLRINNHEHTDLQEYIGTYSTDATGKLSFKEGMLVQAMRHGFWIILDELNLASTDILEALNRVLDDNRELFIPETQTVVKAHPNFMLFATQNPPGLYGGRKTLSRAFKNRFIELHFADIPRPELEIILEKRCLIPASYARKMVLCMSDLQKNRKTTAKNVFTLRDLFRWGNRYTYADKQLLANPKYDWNQHLIEEGYLVLSAKVRTSIEIEIIEETLYRNFKKRVDLTQLFDVQNVQHSSPVTSKILNAISNYKARTDIVWTRNMTRMAVLTAKALQFDEPVLLVGPTGCGKTTVCQLLADIAGVLLRILNCHMHTEGADFLGGLRPCRNQGVDASNKLFEWSDGPLIHAMHEGSYFMADEISLAEDSVLERLNCVLEPERTVLLAEKGGITEVGTNELNNELVVCAKTGFQFLATMNPGGDFGKKELSPALRNRFTEVWCLPSDAKADLVEIAFNCMNTSHERTDEQKEHCHRIANYLVTIVLFIRQVHDKFKFSVRDILAWANYMVSNNKLSFAEQAIFGLETIFLDSLEMLPHESFDQIEALKATIKAYAVTAAANLLNMHFTMADDVEQKRGQEVLVGQHEFGISPFFIATNPQRQVAHNVDFFFDAPTTKQNLFRLLSALTLRKPVLLEGPPGVGKTSIVESIAHAIGYQIVRINLCEHTDLADLFGTDLPAEDDVLGVSAAETSESTTKDKRMGAFVWRDGPLLAALKAENTWILLDELNLAPQSVLEGLNAVLDHRGEVYLPELNKSFQLNSATRIFACQNPLKQGGGRKGLPQSFLNRFNKVYLRKLTTSDLLHVVNLKYGTYFEMLREHFVQLLPTGTVEELADLFHLKSSTRQEGGASADAVEKVNVESRNAFDLAERLVRFSELLEHGVASMEYFYKGGPFEFNLRDILRWCELLHNSETGYIVRDSTCPQSTLELFNRRFAEFLLTLYERMKLVYMQRMRSEQDKLYIRNTFANVFNCNAERLHALSEDVALYWTEDRIYLNDLVLKRDANTDVLRMRHNVDTSPLLLGTQREILKQIVESVHMQKPVLLCGPTDAGKTKLIDALCLLSNQTYNTETIDDSVTGSFQQIDLNRHLEEIAKNIENLLMDVIQNIILHKGEPQTVQILLENWSKYNMLSKTKTEFKTTETTSEELRLFQRRIQKLNDVIVQLKQLPPGHEEAVKEILSQQDAQLTVLAKHVSAAETLNTGGSFEWVDSKIVQSLKCGQYLLLEHVNLCSSAVLDRLNSVFEPNGKLLISEKGVSATDSAEIVEKAPNFRAFLTIDPKNGELSRAMRNRCVELALTKDTYDVDDMRAIVHAQGVHDTKAIDCILRIHAHICELSEIHGYTITHLMQLAFLTAAYKRIGYALQRAIYVSAMEVYVYAAHTDLLGYGLAYYQNKLRDVVISHTKHFVVDTRQQHEDHLANVILRCSDLSTSAMVKLQTTPLSLLLANDVFVPQNELAALFQQFDQLQLAELSPVQLRRYYLYILYESSTLADLKMRHLHVQQLISARSMPQLQLLSAQFYECIAQEARLHQSNNGLPWNNKLYPRIRDCSVHCADDVAYVVSAALLGRLLLHDIPQLPLGKLQQLNALTYAQAVSAKNITDKLNNEFLSHLADFLAGLQTMLLKTLPQSQLSLQQYIRLITGYQWFNRLLSVAQQKIYRHRLELNTDLLDKLLLHFRWLSKHLLHLLAEIVPGYAQDDATFASSLRRLEQYVLHVKQPLSILRKLYAKQFTQFQPFYQVDQVEIYALAQEMDELLNIVPAYGSHSKDLQLNKFQAQVSQVAKQMRALLQQELRTACDYKFQNASIRFKDNMPKALQAVLQNLLSTLQVAAAAAAVEPHVQTESNMTTLATLSQQLRLLVVSTSEQQQPNVVQQLNDVDLFMLPLRDYYLNKVLSQSLNPEVANRPSLISTQYCEELTTLSNVDWQLIATLNAKKHKCLAAAHAALSHCIEHLATVEEFEQLYDNLNDGLYKSLCTYKRLVSSATLSRQLDNLATRTDCIGMCSRTQYATEIDSIYRYAGPPLTNAMSALLLQQHNGQLKPVPLQELDNWRARLQELRQLLWHNARLMTPAYQVQLNNLAYTRRNAKRLQFELGHVQKLCAHGCPNDAGFQRLTQVFGASCEALQALAPGGQPQTAAYQRIQYQTGLTNTLIGALELQLLTFMPLIDPVEKNRLRNNYIVEDIDCLRALLTVYDFMRIVMKYKHFGDEVYLQLEQRLRNARVQQNKFAQKVASRPDICLYSALVQDVTHFLQTNCEPLAICKLLEEVQDIWHCFAQPGQANAEQVERCLQTVSKIELWLANAQRFVQHTLKRYMSYYQDFVQPIRCAVTQTRFGLENVKIVLKQLCTMGAQRDVAKVERVLTNIVQFPTTQKLLLYNAEVYSLLEHMPHGEHDFFALLKVKLSELHHCIALARTIDESQFGAYDFALNVCNQTWQKEEDRRRKQQAEADSLYVSKTRCATEDEELMELQEIAENFPTHLEEDFGEFVAEPTLEQVLKLDKQADLKAKLAQIISDKDYSFLAENFISVMTTYTQVSYHHEVTKQQPAPALIANYQARLSVFGKLYAQYREALNDRIDEAAYNSWCFAVGLQQQILSGINVVAQQQQQQDEPHTKIYDFYKDANIAEIIGCTDVLQRIEERVLVQLELYPEHAGLLDINRVIERIRRLPSTAAVVRYNTGFQLLRQKLALWNEVAHKLNHLRSEETEVAEFVQRWTKLELQHWRICLNQTQELVATQAHRYWFFIYNLCQQYINQEEMDNSYTELIYAEKRFGNAELLDATDVGVKVKVATADVIRILRQFVEVSCYGDFHVRLQLLKAFEMYLQNLSKYSSHSLQPFIAGLHNLQLYFAQFAAEISETNKSRRQPIEKKLKEFVKIESYNKDLSYFSMRNNIARVHRNLNKFLKEYRLQLQEKITPVFQPKDATAKDYNFANDKGKDLRFDTRIKYYMPDAKYFVATEKLRELYIPDAMTVTMVSDASSATLQKVGKNFATARNVVKETVTHANYPNLVIAIDMLLVSQLERCEQLRNLNVDRSKERPKQILEAKQILQQKRKALSDLFKTLTQLGLNYKTGLLESSLRTEFEEFTLAPFCIRTMLGAFKEKHLSATILQLNEHLDLYYAKCVFKLKLLQNVMLAPLSELGPPNIERIKGFAIDMFLLVQNQRALLGTAVTDVYGLCTQLQNLKDVAKIALSADVTPASLDFSQHNRAYAALKAAYCHMRYVLQQFQLILGCAPTQEQAANCGVLQDEENVLCQGTPTYSVIETACANILSRAKVTLHDMLKENAEFLDPKKLQVYQMTYDKLIAELRKILGVFKTTNDAAYLPCAQPLLELLSQVEDTVGKQAEDSNTALPIDFENVDAELANILHTVLMSLQKIYKKHTQPTTTANGTTESPSTARKRRSADLQNADAAYELQKQHLKSGLMSELDTDWQLFNMPRIVGKLDNILLSLKLGPISNEKLQCTRKFVTLVPILEQYHLLAEYFLLQQLGAHKVTAKMLSLMLTVFVEIGTKGFCVPADLMQDEEGQAKNEEKHGDGFGFEDGTGENDVSDKIESEDQLDDAKKPEDRKDDGNKQEQQDCKEEKGIEMSDDFDGKMQDVEKPEKEEDDSGESEAEEELNKEMDETEQGAEQLDDQIWGDDEEEEQKEPEENEKMNDDDQGKGSKDDDEKHNDVDAKNESGKEEGKDEHEKDGLDAANDSDSKDKRKQQENDIDNMNEQEVDEEHDNPHHNELEEPPEAEEMDLGDMNNGDEGQDEGDEQNGDENPFDIDAMKENMVSPEQETTEKECDDAEDENKEENDNKAESSDTDDEEFNFEKKDSTETNNNEDQEDEQQKEEEVAESQPRDELEKDPTAEEEEHPNEENVENKNEEKPEEHTQSKDKSSSEENMQSIPETEQKSSADHVQNQEDNVQQDKKLDEQETGEDKDGIGQAENETNDGGHQGIAETNETITREERKNERETQEKRKQGRTNEERSLGEAEQKKLKQLKTIDKMQNESHKEDAEKEIENDGTPPDDVETEEYQHVREPKNSDKTTLDNATEEQSKQIQHKENEETKEQEEQPTDANNFEDVMEVEKQPDDAPNDEQSEQLDAEKQEHSKSDKAAKTEKSTERMETPEEITIEGELVATMSVPRSADTTAHCNSEIILDKITQPHELSTSAQMELRQAYQQQLTTPQVLQPQHEDYETWQAISHRMTQNARDLCEQLRLILEPTKCTRLKGDYRTGRRINMKKIIPYIASQFRKDKIWLRRTKPAQRDYKITIAIDDSKSMHHNNSKTLTLEAISLVSQALTLLESGRLSIVSFGEAPQIILNHTEPFDGPKLVSALNFAQDKTKIAGLLDFMRTATAEEGAMGGDTGLFENLLLILSDGRNIYSEGKVKVNNAIKLARLQRIFLVYIIIDNPDNKSSILDVQHMEVLPDKSIKIKAYLDVFPFPYYVIVRDLNQLPLVLSEAMRQWFELVNSEQ